MVVPARAGFAGTLARWPRVAICLTGLFSAAAIAMALQVASTAGFALAGFAILQSLVVVVIIRHNHRLLTKETMASAQIHRQHDAIALALKDGSETARSWLWETDAEGILTYASRGLYEDLGLPREDLIGKAFTTLFDVEAGAAGWSRLLLAIDARQSIECAVELPIGPAAIWLQIAVQAVTGPGGRFMGHRGVAHNITSERLARRKLTAERDAALRDNARKSHFLGLMSHELRAPLNAIEGFTELLLSPAACNLPDRQRSEHLETILDSSRHIQRLLSDMLDAARIEKGNLHLDEREADAAEIVEVAVKMCRTVAEKADTTIIARVIDGIELRCDVTRIKQVLVNLVTNAVNFSPPGGHIHVDIETTPSGGLVIAVRDEGNAIRSEEMPEMFEAFAQFDPRDVHRAGSMGLGLPIARNIAMLHGGDVTIESIPGAGTTTRLHLPATRVMPIVQESSEASYAA